MRFFKVIFFIFLIFAFYKIYSKNEEIILYEKKFSSVDPEFFYFYNKFFLLTGAKRDSSLTMGFHTLSENYNGVCLTTLNDEKEILIDPNYWQISSDLMKEMLLAHELGHCLCNREHTSYEDLKWYDGLMYRLLSEKINGFLYDGCPDSLMHYSDFSEFCYIKHFMYYWTEMYDACAEN